MKTLRAWMSEGPFTLALSSSYFGFFSHCGVALALHEEGLRPVKITGASAGALVGGALASGLDPGAIREILFAVEKHHFWDPRPGFGYLGGGRFLEYVRRHLVGTFSEAKIPVELAVFDIFSWQTKFLKEGSLPEAVVASCAVPLMFHPRKIGGRFLWDGGTVRKWGMKFEDVEERILCVFFESEGWFGTYDREATVRKLARDHKILRFKNLPKVGFDSLQSGKEAFAESYRRAARVFDRPVESQIVDG